MTPPFTPDEFFDVFAAYNERLWPFALALWLLTACAVVMLAARRVRPWFIPALLALHWTWSGLAYHAAFFSDQPGCLAVHRALPVRGRAVALVRRRASPVSVVGQSILPAPAFMGADCVRAVVPGDRAGGRACVPRLPTFGVPCPTTILTIGFLLAADRVMPRRVTVIPLVWAVGGGSAALLFGVRADLMLLAAGIALAIQNTFAPRVKAPALLKRTADA